MLIWIDYSLLALVFMSASLGLLRGVKVETYAVFVWLAGIIIGICFCQAFAVLLNFFGEQTLLKLACCFVALLMITLLIGNIIGYLLGELLTRTDLMGRFLGMVVGGIRGLVIIATLTLLAGLSPLPTETWWREARLILPFQQVVLRLRDIFPGDLLRFIHYE